MLTAALWMLGSIAANTIELVLVHWLGSGWPAPVQLFWRQASARSATTGKPDWLP
jgi:hypothetical protein